MDLLALLLANPQETYPLDHYALERPLNFLLLVVGPGTEALPLIAWQKAVLVIF